MIMVIITHFDITPATFKNFYRPFFLTGFFLLSGYVYKKPENFKILLKKKAKAILIPWFFLSIIEIIELTIFGDYDISILMRIFYAIIQIKGMHETLWFLPCLFISFILFYFFTKKGVNIKTLLTQFILCTLSVLYGIYMNPNILPWKSIALPLHMNKWFIATFFMTIGYYLKNNDNFTKRIRNISYMHLAILTIIYLIFVRIVGGHGVEDFSSNSVLIWYMATLMGNMVLLSISMKIPNNNLLLFVGKNSLLYYGLHFTVSRIINNIIEILNLYQLICSNIFIQYIALFSLTALIVLILILPIKFINKHMKFILGKF